MSKVDKAKLLEALNKLNEELKAEGKTLQQSEFDQKSAALEKMRQRQQQQPAK